MKNLGLIPIRNFGIVNEEHELYRSAQPLYGYEYEWLVRTINLRHIINLRDDRDETISVPPHLSDLNVYNIKVKDHNPPDPSQIKRYLDLLKNLSGPILIHCEHGHGRTSTFSVIAKIYLGMNVDEAINDEEYRFHYIFKHHHQEQFLRDYYSQKSLINY